MARAEPEVPLGVIRQWAAHDLFRVPRTVRQVDPVSLVFSEVDVSRALITA